MRTKYGAKKRKELNMTSSPSGSYASDRPKLGVGRCLTWKTYWSFELAWAAILMNGKGLEKLWKLSEIFIQGCRANFLSEW